jgi:hypothetical protein
VLRAECISRHICFGLWAMGPGAVVPLPLLVLLWCLHPLRREPVRCDLLPVLARR